MRVDAEFLQNVLYTDAILGSVPTHKAMGDDVISKHGAYFGGHVDKWEWTIRTIIALTLDEKKVLYVSIKEYEFKELNIT